MLLRGFQPDAEYRGGFVSIGNFDGVHRGHRAMIDALVCRARSADVPAVVLTFAPHPIELLRPESAPPRLTMIAHRAELLESFGVNCVIAYPTDRQLLSFTPAQFFDRILRDELQAVGVVEGPNFCFGKDRSGDVDTLRQLCDANGIAVDIVPPVSESGELISSSVIRRLITDGDLNAAVTMLGHPYRLQGTVERGAGRGADLGFPTANLGGIGTLLPADGVYAGAAVIDGTEFAAAVHLGGNPTFADSGRKQEVHLIGYSGTLYGRELAVDLFRRVRDVRTFASPELLQRQLAGDIATATRVRAERAAMDRDDSRSR